MTDNQKAECLRLWISYPWMSAEERDFTYLVRQLKDVNIEATYDSLRLQQGIRLWQRIEQRLAGINFDGWLYILTHQCLTRKSCAEELVTAIDRMMLRMGPGFPMAGLTHGIAAQQVPTALRVRPCFSLGDPDWRNQVSQVLKNRSVSGKREVMRGDARFVWRIHSCYGGNHAMTAVEVCSKLETVQCWRFAIPKSVQAVRWGQGPAGGGEFSNIRFAVARGSGRYGNCEVSWFGAANAVSNTESAYVVFSGPLPDFVCFGPAVSPFGPPGQMEILRTSVR